jgi:predicted RNase H-related nuclease YkuK (DUF458 family)
MSAITFDTQELVRELRTAGMSQEQAEAVVRTIVKSHTDLATKSDIDTRMAELKLDLIKWIVGLILGQTALLLTVLPKILGH